MRIGKRRLGAAVAALVLVVALAGAAVLALRWRAAGVAHPVTPPPGASMPAFDGPGFERDVSDRSVIIERSLRTERGEPTVRIYAMPDRSPWLQARQVVATQLDHWEQSDACPDVPGASLVECAWREPTRWWPRKVVLTMVRLPATRADGGRRPVTTFVIIGTRPGEQRDAIIGR